jgi:hypothetical protein
MDLGSPARRFTVISDLNLRTGRPAFFIHVLILDDAKDVVHLLERDTFSLRHQKVREDEHRETEGATKSITSAYASRTKHAGGGSFSRRGGGSLPVYEVRSIAALPNGDHHVRRSPRNDEVEEPLGGGRETNVHGAQPRTGDLGDVDPADWAPAKLEERGEEENHDLFFFLIHVYISQWLGKRGTKLGKRTIAT